MRQNPELIHQVMIRRGKSGLLDPEGRPIFTGRDVQTLSVEKWSPLEKRFYEEASEYLQGGYISADEMKGQRRRNLNFAMTVLQKRMASSVAAIRLSLERRIQTLTKRSYSLSSADQQQINDLGKNELDVDDERKEQIEQKLEGIPIRDSITDITNEIKDLDKLYHMANDLKTDTKWESLRNYLRGLFKNAPNEKVIIFTEYRDTLEDLKEKLKLDMPWLTYEDVKEARKSQPIKDFSSLRSLLDKQDEAEPSVHVSVPFEKAVTIIRGGMTQQDRIKAEHTFLKEDCRILLATDAASEGLNLQQKCCILINYELPWNPNRLEQRIGRVHRYGQTRDVKIFNLLNLATREGEILNRLQYKIEEIRNALGSVGEVLGCVARADIEEAIARSLKENISPEITAIQIERAIEEGRRICQQFQEIGLTRLQQFDNTSLKKILGLVDKNKGFENEWRSGEFFQQIMSTFFNTAVAIKKNTGEFKFQVPFELQKPGHPGQYESAVFDKDHPLLDQNKNTVFLGFGHPLIKGVFTKILEDNHKGIGHASFKIGNDAKEAGLLIHYRYKIESEGMRIDSDTGDIETRMETLLEEIIPVFVSDRCCSLTEGELYSNMEGAKADFPADKILPLQPQIDTWTRKAEQTVRERILDKKREIQEERLKKVAMRREDLDRYWNGMNDLYQKRIERYQQEELWSTTDRKAPIGRAKKEIEDMTIRVERQRKALDAMCKVYDYAPDIINAAWIIPRRIN